MPSTSPATPAPVIFTPSSSSSAAASSSTSLAVTDELNGGGGVEQVSAPLVSPPRAMVTSRSAGKREFVGEQPAAVTVAAAGGEVMSHANRLKVTAMGIMDGLVDLARFCENTGASKDLEVCETPIYCVVYVVPGMYVLSNSFSRTRILRLFFASEYFVLH